MKSPDAEKTVYILIIAFIRNIISSADLDLHCLQNSIFSRLGRSMIEFHLKTVLEYLYLKVEMSVRVGKKKNVPRIVV